MALHTLSKSATADSTEKRDRGDRDRACAYSDFCDDHWMNKPVHCIWNLIILLIRDNVKDLANIENPKMFLKNIHPEH